MRIGTGCNFLAVGVPESDARYPVGKEWSVERVKCLPPPRPHERYKQNGCIISMEREMDETSFWTGCPSNVLVVLVGWNNGGILLPHDDGKVVLLFIVLVVVVSIVTTSTRLSDQFMRGLLLSHY